MSREGLWFWFKPTPGKRPLKKNVSSGFPVKQDSEIAPRPSTGPGRSEPAELRRRPSTPLRTDSERGVKRS
jgi:hypothetical protein